MCWRAVRPLPRVYAQSEIHFDLLTRDFFAGLLQSREIGGVVFCYRHDGELVGYNICLEHGGMLIDKYIGLRYPQARELDLYFVSWFVNLEHALERGLRFYVAGWTDPEVKAGSGRGLRSPGIWSGCATRSCAASCTCSGIGLSPTQRPWA